MGPIASATSASAIDSAKVMFVREGESAEALFR